MIELMSLKELMFIKPMNHKEVYYLYFYFLKLNFRFQAKTCNVMSWFNAKDWVSMMFLAIISVRGNYYRIQLFGKILIWKKKINHCKNTRFNFFLSMYKRWIITIHITKEVKLARTTIKLLSARRWPEKRKMIWK